MEKSINEIMKKEHLKIDEMIEKFKNSKDKTSKDSQYLFNKLSWAIKEHFFMEEKLIFSVYDLEVEIHDNNELIDEHGAILKIIKNIDDKKFIDITEELLKLENILKAHSKLEEEIFYENLDNNLSDEEKNEIIIRAKEFLKK